MDLVVLTARGSTELFIVWTNPAYGELIQEMQAMF